MDRNDLLSTAGETLAYAEDYLDSRIELVKLNVAEKGAESGAKLLSIGIVGVIGLAATSCFTIALAIWLGELMSSMPLGFVVVGVGYLIMAAILFIFRRAILTTPLLRALIKQMFKS